MPNLCSLYLTKTHLFLTQCIASDQTVPSISFLDVVPYDPQTLQNTLIALVEKHGLKKASCNWVLNPDFYHLLLVDPPNVLPSEMKDALRWQIRELIDFPPEEATIDYVKIPTGDTEKFYMVVAPIPILKPLAEQIEETGFDLAYIDIPEFAFRNIIALFHETASYCGLLVFYDNNATLVITCQNNLLLSQRMRISPEIDADLAAEIQHGFRYCANQYQMEQTEKEPTNLLMVASDAKTAERLQSLLNFPVKLLALKQKLNWQGELREEDQFAYLSVIGGACRED